MKQLDLDALVVGAGFGGVSQLHSLLGLGLGLSVKVIDQAPEVGGTWFWNKYPGAMSDTGKPYPPLPGSYHFHNDLLTSLRTENHISTDSPGTKKISCPIPGKSITSNSRKFWLT